MHRLFVVVDNKWCVAVVINFKNKRWYIQPTNLMANFHCLANKNKIDRIQSYVLIEIVNILKNKYNVSFIDAVTFMIELYTLKYIQCSVHINLDVDVDV